MLDHVALGWACKYFHGGKKKSKFFFSFHTLSSFPKEGLCTLPANHSVAKCIVGRKTSIENALHWALSGGNTNSTSSTRLLKRTESVCSPHCSSLHFSCCCSAPICILSLLFRFWMERKGKDREWIVVGWRSLLFQLALLKCPPSQVQLERSIYLQYVITLSFLPLTLRSPTSFLLDVRHCSRGYQRMLGEKMDIMLEGNSTWSHAPALQGRFHWVASQKGPHAWPEKKRGVRKKV